MFTDIHRDSALHASWAVQHGRCAKSNSIKSMYAPFMHAYGLLITRFLGYIADRL